MENEELKEVLNYILENRSHYFQDNKALEKDFIRDYETILLHPHDLPLDTMFLLFFRIIKEAIMKCDNLSFFNNLKSLITIKNFFNYEKADIPDIKMYFDYLVTYCYYYSLSTHHLNKLMNYFKDHFDEIIEWCIINDFAFDAFEGIYFIKRDKYNYVTKYIEDRLLNKNEQKIIIR